ncbi:MAG: class I SAM-dependent methyltransferase [Balneolaceae bacterium]
MNRLNVLQKLIDKTGAKTYLEIGVFNGEIISHLKCPTKIGVDPNFQLRFANKVRKFLPDTRYKTIEVTSDVFFQDFACKTLSDGIDVAFVDGLHTYDQALRDVENCLQYLNKDGFIVMHDCNPLNEATAYPVEHSINEVLELAKKGEVPGWNGSWNGDVWKALVHLRATRDDLHIFTLDLDWGLGIIGFGKPESKPEIAVDELKKQGYALLEKDRVNLLNLKKPSYLNQL